MDRGAAAMETAPLLLAGTQRPMYSSIQESDSLGPADLSSREILYTYRKQFERPVKIERKKQSSLVTIFSVWNTVMGSSLLTMAWGVERAGLPIALVLVAVMAALCLYTAYMLLRVNHHHGSATCEVPALCLILLGSWAERVAHFFSLMVLLGANVVYWVLMTNFLYFTAKYFIDMASSNGTQYNTTLVCPNDAANNTLIIPEEVSTESSYWAVVVPLCVTLLVFPLMNFRNVSFFTKFNSLGTLSVLYMLVFVIVKGYMWGIHIEVPSVSEVSQTGGQAAVLSGMLALSFYIHNIIITIMSNNDRQDKNGRDLSIAFLLVTLTYTMVGVIFYICFPLAKSCIEDNMLNNFDMHDVMTAIARMLLLFQVMTVYPLVAFLFRSEALLLLPLSTEVKGSCWTSLAFNVMIIGICITVACLCPNIGTIIRYTGAVSGLVHVFALPSLLYARSLHLRGKLTCWRAIFYICIVLFGVVNLIMQFFITQS